LRLPIGQIANEETIMKRVKFLLAVGILLIATSPLYLHAQEGCEDSPENPTAVLALLGSAAACAAYARRRFLAGKADRDENR
jgi:XrtJ-associated TM-motif-TM protein